MKISIITVTRNAAATVRRALESVKAQIGDFDLEHIVVDGQSTDDTLSILKEYSHLNRLISEPDKGIFDAMNKGIQCASGAIVGILNADDEYYNSLILNDIHQIFNENPNIDMIYGHVLYHLPCHPNRYVRYWKAQPFSERFFEKGFMMPHTSLFIRKTIYDKEGLYKIKYGVAADYEFMFRVLKRNIYTPFVLNKTLVKTKAGGSSNNGIKTYRQITQAQKAIWNEYNMKYPFPLYYKRPLQKILQLLHGLCLNISFFNINKLN